MVKWKGFCYNSAMVSCRYNAPAIKQSCTHLRLSDLALPGFGTSLAFTRCLNKGMSECTWPCEDACGCSPGPPVALHEAPCAGHVHRVPRVPEPVVLELDPGLVTSGLAVALDDHTVQPGVAGTRRVRRGREATRQQCCII